MSIDKELVAKAHAIIDGIPEEHICLNAYVRDGELHYSCGTIACGAGFLGMHPDFNAMGFRLERFDPFCTTVPFYKGAWANDAVDKLFGDDAFDRMFATHGEGAYDDDLLDELWNRLHRRATDKELLLARMKKVYYMEDV